MTFDQRLQAHERVYWSATDKAEIGHHDRFSGSEAEAVERLDSLLRDAVRLRTVSDVPLGVLLSGGIDSSTVLALLQQESPRTIRSFSIGFPDSGLDEAPAARKIAAHIGSDHTELYMAPNDIIQLIPSLARLSDQPQSDPSYVSNHVAYRLAGQSVTVTLCRRRRRRAIRGLPPPSMAAKGVATARLAAGRDPEARSASADGDPTGDVGQGLRHHRAGGPLPATGANPWRQAPPISTLDGLCLPGRDVPRTVHSVGSR